MKNSKRLKVLCIAVLMPLFSCQKNEPVLEVRKITPAMIGEIHNRVMTNFKNNYVPNKGMTEDQIIDDIISYNLNLIDEELKGFRKIELDYMGNFYMREIFNTEQLIHNSFIERSSANSLSQKELKASDMNVFEIIIII